MRAASGVFGKGVFVGRLSRTICGTVSSTRTAEPASDAKTIDGSAATVVTAGGAAVVVAAASAIPAAGDVDGSASR